MDNRNDSIRDVVEHLAFYDIGVTSAELETILVSLNPGEDFNIEVGETHVHIHRREDNGRFNWSI